MPAERAVVIGAGLGGLSVATQLARHGCSVDLYEKNSYAGGRCATMTRNGFRFDVGATLFLMPDIFRRAFADLGENIDDHLTLLRVDPTSEVFFQDGKTLALTADCKELSESLERFERGSFGRALSYLNFGHDAFHTSLTTLMEKDFRKARDFFTVKNLTTFASLRVFSNHYGMVARAFKSPHLRAAFSYHDLYVGLDPHHAPGMYAMLPALELLEGLYYPKGGMASIATALLSIAEKNGVRFHPETPVERILTRDGRACGVSMHGEDHPADIIVANADAPYAYRELLGETLRRRFDYSCSAYTFYWSLSRRIPQINHQHNIFVSEDYRGELSKIFGDNGFSPRGHFYANFPSRTDPEAAPEGQDSAMVIVPCGHTVGPERDWESEQAQAREWVLHRLSRCGLPDIEGSIRDELAFTPKTWESGTNLTGGAVFGSLNHKLLQMGYFRLPNRHPKYHNLYFVGGSTAPGSGLPMVLIGARLTGERIVSERSL